MTGLETAHYLAANSNDVSVFEMADEIGPGLYFQNLIDVMNHIKPLGVKLYPKHKLVKIEGKNVVFENTETGTSEYYEFDYVVLSLGRVPSKESIDEIKSAFDRVFVLGDAREVGRIRNAMETGFLTAYNL